MAAASNGTINHQNHYHCTICLEGLAVHTTVTLRCRHTFHLDCLGSAFNAGNAMWCPVCPAVEESGRASWPELLGAAERVPVWPRKMCRSPLSEW